MLGIASIVTAVFGRELQAQTMPSPSAGSKNGPSKANVRLTVNGQARDLALDPRTTLLDALRDHLGLAGTKKGCDHGQCGACTVLVNGVRHQCLPVARRGARGRQHRHHRRAGEHGKLHPLQEAFVEHDGFQCGYCTPGQICSAVGMLDEIQRGVPSAVGDLAAAPQANGAEIRERMSGNICRCSAYPNIVAAIMDAQGRAG